MRTKDSRVDELGRAYAGSQLQIQIYVNRWSEELSQKLIQGLPDLALLYSRLNWVSPLEKDRFVEYQDRTLLKACGFKHLFAELKAFWPCGGPAWDALVSIEFWVDNGRIGISLGH